MNRVMVAVFYCQVLGMALLGALLVSNKFQIKTIFSNNQLLGLIALLLAVEILFNGSPNHDKKEE
jgi:hypothetical protein